eukprot:UC1_evm1s139
MIKGVDNRGNNNSTASGSGGTSTIAPLSSTGSITDTVTRLHDSPFARTPIDPGAIESLRARTLYALGSLTRRSAPPPAYTIASASGRHVVRFALAKSRVRLGDDVTGWFDFADAQCTCLHIFVRLECVETLRESVNAQPGLAPATTIAGSNHISCEHALTTAFTLAVPLSATAAFDSDYVSIGWQLAFDFVLKVPGNGEGEGEGEGIMGKANEAAIDKDPQAAVSATPATIPSETMSWTLPIA